MIRERRTAILEGTKAASQLHHDLQMQESIEKRGGGIDVFGALISRGAALLFRPLDGLLGACLLRPVPGVLISTQRPLRIQRFTGAHELGHLVLGHQATDGAEILERTASSRVDIHELAADAFASEFLIPKWLLQIHARQQGWNRKSMHDPLNVYQLSLRIAASYDATCRALFRDKIIDSATLSRLQATSRKAIKAQLLDGHSPPNWYPDVWLLTERDKGFRIEGQPGDLFVLKLKERPSSGYLWSVEELTIKGFAVVNDRRSLPEVAGPIGGAITRTLTTAHPEAGMDTLHLQLRRPWITNEVPLEEFVFLYDLLGKEVGLPRALRGKLVAVS